MGKKDYQLFADALSLIKAEEDMQNVKKFLFDVFYKDNPRFDSGRFNEWIRRRQNNETMKGTKYNPKYMPLGIK